MENKISKVYLLVLNILLFVIVSMFMYNFYKALSGFIANNFDDGLVMITIISSYLLPVFSYLYFFYQNYVRKDKKIVKIIFDIILIAWSIFNLINIFINISLYASNNALGVYDTMPSLIFLFPYDMIIVNILILTISGLSIYNIFKPTLKINDLFSYFSLEETFSIKKYEYTLISILAILVFVFFGAFLISFEGIANVFYDPKYIFLMLWVLIVPLSSLTLFIFKFEKKLKTKKNKAIYLSSLIGINVLFIALLLIFEAIYPSFIVYIGKPIFAIAFSISLPIEMLVLLFIGILTIIFALIYLIRSLMSKEQ